MFALFENCSSTSEERKAPVKPLELVASCERVFQMVYNDAKERDLYNLKYKKEYYEIFYWLGGFEVSITILQSTQGNRTYLHAMVYGEKKRGRTRKKLKQILEYYKGLLSDLIA